MATIEENKAAWDGDYTWHEHGDEWSVEWGGPASQWYGCLFPRLRHLLPASHILEIAPGYGRWTQFLASHARLLTLVDLSSECIDACKRRFQSTPNIQYHVNDGKTLDMLSDESVELVFSFDSLVHAEEDVIECYINEIDRILKPGGHAFIHHSNMNESSKFLKYIPDTPRQYLRKFYWGCIANAHWRARSMSASRLIQLTSNTNLHCIAQEKINWRTRRALIDCISVLQKCSAPDKSVTRILENRNFMREAAYINRINTHYRTRKDEATSVSRPI